jgi:hypothetical protein
MVSDVVVEALFIIGKYICGFSSYWRHGHNLY